jgi:hypothetical protein
VTAGDVGVAIVCNAGGFNLTGATCALLAAPGRLAQGEPIRFSPMTVSDNGSIATYTTTGTDFTAPGPWQFQLEVATNTGQVFTSPPVAVYIFPIL